jgi:hypothetical protein
MTDQYTALHVALGEFGFNNPYPVNTWDWWYREQAIDSVVNGDANPGLRAKILARRDELVQGSGA